MSLHLVFDVWQEIKQHIAIGDRLDAAEHLVDVLIDHDHDPDTIQDVFKSDAVVKRALAGFLDEGELQADDDDDDGIDESY